MADLSEKYQTKMFIMTESGNRMKSLKMISNYLMSTVSFEGIKYCKTQ